MTLLIVSYYDNFLYKNFDHELQLILYLEFFFIIKNSIVYKNKIYRVYFLKAVTFNFMGILNYAIVCFCN